MTRVRHALAGKQFFITGATGFLGTALVERVLRSVPDSQVVLLIRPGRRADPLQRATKEILKNDCFDLLRERARGPVRRRGRGPGLRGGRATWPTTVSGSTTTACGSWRSATSSIHSAASVSFDSPLDTAVEVNLLGPSRVAAAIGPPGSCGRARSHRPRPFIPVSTAYVAGTHQGEALEELLEGNRFTVDVDWRDRSGRPPGDTRGDTRGRVPPAPTAWTSSPRRLEVSWAVPGSTSWPSGPSSCARTG